MRGRLEPRDRQSSGCFFTASPPRYPSNDWASPPTSFAPDARSSSTPLGPTGQHLYLDPEPRSPSTTTDRYEAPADGQRNGAATLAMPGRGLPPLEGQYRRNNPTDPAARQGESPGKLQAARPGLPLSTLPGRQASLTARELAYLTRLTTTTTRRSSRNGHRGRSSESRGSRSRLADHAIGTLAPAATNHGHRRYGSRGDVLERMGNTDAKARRATADRQR